MSGVVARAYHDRTKLTWRGVRSSGHVLDWDNQPSRLKRYLDLPVAPLPVALRESDWPAIDALSGEGPPNRQTLDEAWLASLLFFSAGITRRWQRNGRPLHFRAAPSAGALYPIEAYVVCGELSETVAAGVYHFDPNAFGLRSLRDGDHRAVLARAAVDERIAAAPATVVLTAIPYRSTWKYRLRGYRHLYWDAGAIAGQLTTLAAGMSEEAVLHTGFVDDAVGHLLGLDADVELPVAVIRLGPSDGRPADDRPDPPALRHRVAPVAPEAPELGDLLATHRVADLPSARAVSEWREAMRALQQGTATRITHPPALPTFETVEEVVLRRGSTRRFARAEIPTDALTWPVAAAAGAVRCDVLEPGDTLLWHGVIVHGVAGVRPGAFAWTPRGPRLLRPGYFRGEATALCLEQTLGGEAAYTVFHMADLDTILEKGGERAYRAVHLEAGVAAARLQLATHTLGVGATGLTFYDDDVRRFFDTGDEPLLVTAVGPSAYRSRPGRRPADQPPVGRRGAV